MFRGTIGIVTDRNICLSLLQNTTIINISGNSDPEMDQYSIKASVLLPPYKASMAMVDGDMMNFQSEYMGYLASDVANQFILLLIKGLFLDKHYILYITPDEAQMGYLQCLEKYLSMIGITANQNIQIQYDSIQNKLVCIYLIKMLYANDIIDANEFIMFYNKLIVEYNAQVILEPQLEYKIINELKPFLGSNPQPIDISRYINNRIVNGSKFMNPINPFQGIYK